MIRLTKTLQGQLERKEEDVVSAQQREAASEKLLQQMQSSIKQLETRLHVTVQDAEQMRTERTALEKQIRMLQTKCANLERENYEAVAEVQDCVQLLEEANLQKSRYDVRAFKDLCKFTVFTRRLELCWWQENCKGKMEIAVSVMIVPNGLRRNIFPHYCLYRASLV
ncbi:sodium channel and clathrin linker 1-like [Meleagris gallopavo]|uniref:sodium channel and clathrin linker 1-like n=1 Tax=Meleagris gallopavo TaxID=9103 RepID=UPI00093CFB71|nr:sodium channel and clathrin linker 1-like [Meleagris gallopavo]